MSDVKTKKTTSAAETTATVASNPVEKIVKKDFNDMFADGVKNGKEFPLLRSYYVSDRTGRAYYSYNMFLVLPGSRQKFERIELVPDIGFVSDKKAFEKTGKNSDAYRLLNWYCDIGGELSLIAKIDKKLDEAGKEVFRYSFFARVYDDQGIPLEFPMKTRTNAANMYLLAGFAGAGRSRAVQPQDFEAIPELLEEYQRIIEASENMPDGIESEAEKIS